MGEYAAGLGLLASRLPLLGLTACVCAFTFTGWIPPLGAFVMVVPFGLVAAALITALYLCIGLLAFWLEDISPVYWVWQKLAFILGGLMLPLDLYPHWVQGVAALTPFPAILGGPASFVLSSASPRPGWLALSLLFWCTATGYAAWWIFRRAASNLTVNGG
jgi:ABC-2 type transport system permease protein